MPIDLLVLCFVVCANEIAIIADLESSAFSGSSYHDAGLTWPYANSVLHTTIVGTSAGGWCMRDHARAPHFLEVCS